MRRQPVASSRGRCRWREEERPLQESVKTVNWFRHQHDLLLQRKLRDNQLRQRVAADVIQALNLSEPSSPSSPARMRLRQRSTSDSESAPMMLASSSVGSFFVPGAHSAERAARRRGAQIDTSTQGTSIDAQSSASARPHLMKRALGVPRIQSVEPKKSSNTPEESFQHRAQSASRVEPKKSSKTKEQSFPQGVQSTANAEPKKSSNAMEQSNPQRIRSASRVESRKSSKDHAIPQEPAIPQRAQSASRIEPKKSSNTLDGAFPQNAQSASRDKLRANGFGLGGRMLPWSPRESSPVQKSGESVHEAKVSGSTAGRSRSPTGRRPKAKAALAAVMRRSMTGHSNTRNAKPHSSHEATAKLEYCSEPHILGDAAQDLQQAASALRRITLGNHVAPKERAPVHSEKLPVGSPQRPSHARSVERRIETRSATVSSLPSNIEWLIPAAGCANQGRPVSDTESSMYQCQSMSSLCPDSPELDSVTSYVPWLDEGRSAALQGENAALRKELARASEQGEELERLQRLAEERRLELEKEKDRLLKTFEACPSVGIGILSLEEQNRALRDELSEATRGQTQMIQAPGSAERQRLEEQLRGVEERCRALEAENARLQRLDSLESPAVEYAKPHCKINSDNSLHQLLVMTERAGRQMNEVLQRNGNVRKSYECVLSSAGA